MQAFTPAKHSAATDNDTLLILRDSEDLEKTDGGLYKPQRAVEIANQGEVRASAEGSQYNAGDRIVFVKYAGAVIELNGIEYVLLKEKEVQGIVRTIDMPSDAKPQTSEDVNAAAQAALAQLEKQANA